MRNCTRRYKNYEFRWASPEAWFWIILIFEAFLKEIQFLQFNIQHSQFFFHFFFCFINLDNLRYSVRIRGFLNKLIKTYMKTFHLSFHFGLRKSANNFQVSSKKDFFLFLHNIRWTDFEHTFSKVQLAELLILHTCDTTSRLPKIGL